MRQLSTPHHSIFAIPMIMQAQITDKFTAGSRNQIICVSSYIISETMFNIGIPVLCRIDIKSFDQKNIKASRYAKDADYDYDSTAYDCRILPK
jgi:hypothetical protein